MVRRCSLVAATCLLIAFLGACLGACPPPSAPASGPPVVDDSALRIRIAQAEARRAGGVAELVELTSHGGLHEKVLALRGLGRIGMAGGPPVQQALRAALADRSAEVVGAAASAIGVAASLDDADPTVSDALVAALPRGGAPVVEALGRAGAVAVQPELTKLLGDPKLGPLAALALARHGRRKLALAAASRSALVAASGSADADLRYAVVYALAREFEPPDDAAAAAALVARLSDPIGEVRAHAIAGLGKRKAIAAARAGGARIDELLFDRDWRVAVEAVRALADSDDGKDAIATALVRRFGDIERGDLAAAQVILEGERALAGAAQRPVVGDALRALVARSAAAQALPALTRGWIECLAIAAAVRAQPEPDLTAVERCGLADRLRLPLVADLITANVGGLPARRAALSHLLAHREPRVHAAGLGALTAMWKAGDASDHHAIAKALAEALAAADLTVAGAATDAAGELYDAIGTEDHAWLDTAVVARATAEHDDELGAALLALIGKRKLAAGHDACRASLTTDPVRAKAGAACLQALGEPAPAIALPAASPPPVDVTAVIGKQLRWHVVTSRGEVVIQLRPDVAPWAVATIVALTRKGFYDGLEFHRVVPNFVVQGGDPSESGTGGPGFMIPSEPATLTDGAGYIAGGVGIADSGRDSGGSQWFIMHSRAPHLDGRYTWFGSVSAGQKTADALLVGDRIEHATIEPGP